MAFDKDRHEFDAQGFIVEKDTKQISGQAERWFVPSEDTGAEYPKWVKPHKDFVVEVNGNKVAPLYPDFSAHRDTNEVWVLVHDAAEEEHAIAEHEELKDESGSEESEEKESEDKHGDE